MKRKGHISQKITTAANFEDAFYGYADQKHGRKYIKKFEENLNGNLQNLRCSYETGTWKTSDYQYKLIYNPKKRLISKLPPEDHIIQWAALNQCEDFLYSTLIRNSCSCIKNKGTHFFVRRLKHDLFTHPERTQYFVQLDIHHYFPSINHELMKERYRRKIKDPKLLLFMDEFVDSYSQGLPLGVKISQLLANLYLAPFDRTAIQCFGIGDNAEKLNYWAGRYVSGKFVSCRTQEQANELAAGVHSLSKTFSEYVKQGLRFYYRFADNIVILHHDKTFLHLITELAIMHLSRDFLLQVNKSWNVRPVHSGGIDVCGYVFFHDHLRLRKRNKQALCRQEAKLRKKGLSKRDIRIQCASRAGFASHANTRNLLKKLNMEKRLGKVINNRKKKAPFKDMTVEQKTSIEDIICHANDPENEKLIQLIDYIIDDSVIEKNDDGTPKLRIAVRYRKINHIDNPDTDEAVYHWSEKEYYSFSGSKIMIEQAENDFSKDDLPVATVIREFINEKRKKFYKFT
jgi:hypothetical protein